RDRPGVVVDEEDLGPVLAAVGGLVDAALGVGGEQMAEGGGVHDVGILRVHNDPTDDVGRAQADEAPVLAAVGGLVHAAAGEDGVAGRGVAGADVEDLRIRGRHRHGADAAGLEVAVGEVAPVVAVVGRLPDAAAGGSHVENVGLVGNAGHGGDASAGEGADAAPVQGAGGRGLRRHRGGNGQQKSAGQQGTACGEHGGGPPKRRCLF